MTHEMDFYSDACTKCGRTAARIAVTREPCSRTWDEQAIYDYLAHQRISRLVDDITKEIKND